MHLFNAKSGYALACAEAETFKVNQVHDETVQGELERRLEKCILALAKTVEDRN